ncbi:MAG TPA: hypothetical protein VF554_11575, partial [Thermoanaerobaculia bacterium]
RPPDTRFFEELFLRFQRRVATETLTRPAGNPGAFDAESFFAEWVEEERGLVGEERARAFAWLARHLGFECELEDSLCSRPWASGAPDVLRLSEGAGGFSSKANGLETHRAVVARVQGRRILADAGFPLPVIVPLEPLSKEIPTGFGPLSVQRAEDEAGFRITCDARGQETELLRVDLAARPSPLPLKETSRTSQGAPPESEAHGSFALRVLDDRVLFWRAGRMTILDAWSRLEYSLPSSARAAIEKLFALELGGVSLPEERLREAPRPATLSVFHLSPVTPREARGRVGRDTRPLALVSGREERVEAAPGGSLITIRATLADVPPEGPGEAVRKTLVFHLASELFEVSRNDGRTD